MVVALFPNNEPSILCHLVDLFRRVSNCSPVIAPGTWSGTDKEESFMLNHCTGCLAVASSCSQSLSMNQKLSFVCPPVQWGWWWWIVAGKEKVESGRRSIRINFPPPKSDDGRGVAAADGFFIRSLTQCLWLSVCE